MIQKGFSHVYFIYSFNPNPSSHGARAFVPRRPSLRLLPPPTNFNKVALSASPAQQQRQGVSFKKEREIREAFQALRQYLNGDGARGVEEKIDSYVHGLQQLRKWRRLITAYLAFFQKDKGVKGLNPDQLQKRLTQVFITLDSESRYGEGINTVVPLSELIEQMKQQGFEVDTLVAKWKELQTQVGWLIRILEGKHKQTTKLLNAKVIEAHDAVYGG
jgi:hypothetical protein